MKKSLDKEKCGVLIGSGMGGLTIFQDSTKSLFEKGVKKVSPFFIPYAITNMSGALLAIEMGSMGPNYSISTACATANYAFFAAANHIRKGEAELMVAGKFGGKIRRIRRQSELHCSKYPNVYMYAHVDIYMRGCVCVCDN